MRAAELAIKLREFRNLLQEHYDLWRKSLGHGIPDYPGRNVDELWQQQKKLFRLLYVLDEYLTQ